MVEFRENIVFVGVDSEPEPGALLVGVVLELALLKRPLPPPPPPVRLPKSPGAEVGVLEDPAIIGADAGAALVDVGVVEAGLPNRFVDCAGFAALPKRLGLEGGVWELLLNNPEPPPPDVGVDPSALFPVVCPNNGFCSPGLVAVFPKGPGVVPDEPAAALLFPPPRFPKEKAGVPVVELPNRLVEAEVVGVDEPNKLPEGGAVEVVALLLDCPPELELPKSDMVGRCL